MSNISKELLNLEWSKNKNVDIIVLIARFRLPKLVAKEVAKRERRERERERQRREK